MMISWYGQLESAGSVEAVVAIARDYGAMLSPEEIAMLPPGARPGRIRDESDITELHERLVDEYRKTRASGAELALLQRVTGFFVRACVRIAELGGARENDDAANSEDSQKLAAPDR
jgi:hypothetical protein